MAAPNPVTDPLYAYDTFGWTNQQTGDVPTVGAAQNVVSPYDAELGGTIASTMDAAGAVTAAFTPAITTSIFYGGLVYIGGPVKSTKFFASVTAAGTTSHAYVALLSTAGVPLALSADLTTLASGTGSWAVAPVLASGFYYLGIASVSSVAATFAGTANAGVLCGNAPGLVYSNTNQVFPKFVQSAVTITASFPASVTLVAQATGSVGSPFVALF